jgi:hypothetical protein
MRRSADAWVRTMAWIDVLRNTFAPDNGAMP